jgi:hypothetical protein
MRNGDGAIHWSEPGYKLSQVLKILKQAFKAFSSVEDHCILAKKLPKKQVQKKFPDIRISPREAYPQPSYLPTPIRKRTPRS